MTAPDNADSAGVGTLFPEAAPRSLEVLRAEADAIVRRANRDHAPKRTFLLFSGGSDSLVTLDALWYHADAIVHINTGIGLPEATDHAREVAAGYNRPFIELTPPRSYDDLVLNEWQGFPGPGAHRFTFIRLKERCIEQLIRDHRDKRGDRFLLLTGARKAESVRRMGHGDVERRKGGQVWLNPLWSWTNDEMRAWRANYDLPLSEVAVHLHMSGECLCGAMADQDQNRSEREAIKFFYPAFDARLCALEAECRRRGLRYAEWGVKRPPTERAIDGQSSLWGVDELPPLCVGCEARAFVHDGPYNDGEVTP